MHAGNQYLLVVRSVKDANPSAFGKVAGGAPEKIVLQFTGAGMLEAEDLAALRIDPRHHVPDGAVFSSRVHGLKNQQNCMAIRRIEKLLLRAQFCDVLPE